MTASMICTLAMTSIGHVAGASGPVERASCQRRIQHSPAFVSTRKCLESRWHRGDVLVGRRRDVSGGGGRLRSPIITGGYGRLTRSPSRLWSTQKTRSADELSDDDLVALPFDAYVSSASAGGAPSDDASEPRLRLCVICNRDSVFPLVRHEDDVETDLFLDPRHTEKAVPLSDVLEWSNAHKSSSANRKEGGGAAEVPYYGMGWYGQRPVPSLGGGPGYGAEADEIWSVDGDVLDALGEEGVDVPVIDVGMAHGEKARGGALF